MPGKVLSLHDGFYPDGVQGKPVPPKPVGRFDNETLMVDERIAWEREAGYLAEESGLHHEGSLM